MAGFQNERVGDLREHVFDVSFERLARNTFILTGEMDDQKLKTALIDTLVAHGFSIQDSITVFSHELSAPLALIDLSVATMRSASSHLAPMVSQALMGMPVRVLKQAGGWVYVQTPDRYLGWCERSAVYLTDSLERERWKKSQRVLVTSRYSTIRDVESGAVLSDLVAGCLLEQTRRRGDGIYVKTPGGIEGIVEASDVMPFDADHFPDAMDVEKLEATALSLMRTPYLWGGTSVGALDCSGFTKTVYWMQGFILARDASLQARYGEDVPVDKGWELFKKGDLLFFSPDEGSERITHVGLYLDDSEFIHEAGKVKINSLDSTRVDYSDYRARTLVKARRLEGSFSDEGIVHWTNHPWYVEQ